MPSASASVSVMPGQQVEGVLLGQLGEQAAELLQRRGAPEPVSGSMPKSMPGRRPAPGRRPGRSTVAWTVTSWKSSVRAWNSSGCSRSSTGISLSAAVSGRNQNAWPGPSCATLPLAQVAHVGGRRRPQVAEERSAG